MDGSAEEWPNAEVDEWMSTQIRNRETGEWVDGWVHE